MSPPSKKGRPRKVRVPVEPQHAPVEERPPQPASAPNSPQPPAPRTPLALPQQQQVEESPSPIRKQMRPNTPSKATVNRLERVKKLNPEQPCLTIGCTFLTRVNLKVKYSANADAIISAKC